MLGARTEASPAPLSSPRAGLTLGPEGPAGPAAPWSPEGPCGGSAGGWVPHPWVLSPPGAQGSPPKPSTYGWSGQPLQAGEAAVTLQPPLSSLSGLALVTARPLGTLAGDKGTREAQGGRSPHPWHPVAPVAPRCHSPAFRERRRGRRDPWDPVRPAERKGPGVNPLSPLHFIHNNSTRALHKINPGLIPASGLGC